MFSINKIKKLSRQLFPSGRAFNYPIDGGLDKLMSALAVSEKNAIDDNYSVLYQILPDNDNFTVEDATKWEDRLGMINGSAISLTDRKSAIIRKMNHPGDVTARQSWDYLQNSLQTAGFDVYVHENTTDTPTMGATVIQSGQRQLNQYQCGAMPYLFKIAKSLDAEIDSNFVLTTDYRSTFIIGGPVYGDTANVLASRELEFRQLVLKIKPTQTISLLKINYI